MTVDADGESPRPCLSRDRLRLSRRPRRQIRLIGVDFGCAWLRLEQGRVRALHADGNVAVARSACTGVPRRRRSRASLRVL
jgi:hypothetical protein